ncbi:Holliday junction branch migration protein RuvA [Candidatus Methylacidithermus pantelleriae]|nr:Holliday junction branch migration protein RuvA [Candidatus Methylacidithermus pantelleriae]
MEKEPGRALVRVSGVGWELAIPLSTYQALPRPPAPVRLWTYWEFRDTGQALYGFGSREERELFRLLVDHVQGIGPKSALSILSVTHPERFREAVRQGDRTFLASIRGIGKKMAERIVFELKDRLKGVPELASGGQPRTKTTDAVLALVALGYRQSEATKAVEAVVEADPHLPLEELVRQALRRL